MVLTAWIILISFGFIALSGIGKYVFSSITRFHFVCTLLSIILAAVAAGYIFVGF